MRVDRPRIVLGLVASAVLLFAVGVSLHSLNVWREALHSLFLWGGWPIFAIFTIVYNSLIIPFPYDPFLLVMPVLFPELPMLVIWVVATLGMTVAAAVAYGLSRSLLGPRLFPLLQRQRGYRRAERLMQRYGLMVLVLSTVVPLPYSLVCWLAGFLRLPLALTLMVTFCCRGLRNACVLWVAFHLLPN